MSKRNIDRIYDVNRRVDSVIDTVNQNAKALRAALIAMKDMDKSVTEKVDELVTKHNDMLETVQARMDLIQEQYNGVMESCRATLAELERLDPDDDEEAQL